jgi:hypothetical protein
MRNIFRNFFVGLFLVLSICSCATYQIPVESLKLQFTGIDSSKLVEVIATNHKGDEYSFMKNPIKILKCLDNDNNPMIIYPTPRLMMIVTDKYNNKIKLSFDRVYVNSAYLYGTSLFISEVLIRIPLEEIIKVQIRDDKRKFLYGNVDIRENH